MNVLLHTSVLVGPLHIENFIDIVFGCDFSIPLFCVVRLLIVISVCSYVSVLSPIGLLVLVSAKI
jgi:hypothetical protein